MARRRIEQLRQGVPVWLLGEWGERAAEAMAWCLAHGISPVTVLVVRAAAKAPGLAGLTPRERAEVSSWEVEGETGD